jgi:hypothetical protein
MERVRKGQCEKFKIESLWGAIFFWMISHDPRIEIGQNYEFIRNVRSNIFKILNAIYALMLYCYMRTTDSVWYIYGLIIHYQRNEIPRPIQYLLRVPIRIDDAGSPHVGKLNGLIRGYCKEHYINITTLLFFSFLILFFYYKHTSNSYYLSKFNSGGNLRQ